MKKVYISLAIIVVIVGGYFALFDNRNKANVSQTESAVTTETTGWIDIVSSKVSIIDDSGVFVKDLATGDAIPSGTTIKTDATGKGSIYFSDGSSIKIEPNTVLKVSEGTYDSKSGTLKVKVTLDSGKIWNKITNLATPESHWEAKTGSAVATVRGTAFILEYTAKGETNVVTVEHNVSVTPLDPDTGEEMPGADVEVKESESLNLKQDQIKVLKALTKEERETRKETILKRQILESKTLESLKAELETKDEDSAEDDTGIKIETKPNTVPTTNKDVNTQTKTSPPTTNTNITAPAGVSKVTGLKLINKAGIIKLTEGNSLTLDAELQFSDGTSKIVTDKCVWQVLGSIGAIARPGMFKAALGSDVSEIGTAFGAVTATYKTEDGKEFTAKSEIITVTGAVDSNQDTRG